MRYRSRVTVSVIMPARNVESYIDEAIQSALAQRGVVYELLIVDDASTDNTWKHIQNYQNDPRVRIWQFRKQRGAGGARNYLLKHAKGTYIAFCDADDRLLPGYLQTMVRAFNHKPKVGVVYADRVTKDRSGKSRLQHRSRGPAETWDLFHGPISNGGTLVRRSVLQKMGGYRVDLPLLEDYDFFWRLAEVTRFLHLKGKPLYFYRKRSQSLSHEFKRKRSEIQRNILRTVIARRYDFQVTW